MDAVLAALPLFTILLVVYFFAVLPRQRKTARHAALVSSLRVNDVVTTSGGVQGRVTGWKGTLIMVEVAPGVVFDIDPAKVESASQRAATARPTGCVQCGAPLDPNDEFCGECGAAVDAEG